MVMPGMKNTAMIDKDEIDIFEYIKVIKDNRWFIILCMAIFIVVGVCYVKLSTPVYQANVIFKIDSDKSRISNFGQNIANLFSLSSSTTIEREIIQSRGFLRKTINELNLTTVVTPQKTSFLNSIMAGLSRDPKVITIDKLVTIKNDNEKFKLVVTNEKLGRYTLTNMTTKRKLNGEVGKLATNSDSTIFVSSINAKKGDVFNISKIDSYQAAINLQNRLQVKEIGKSSLSGTGILEISLTGTNKNKIQHILANISDNYLLFNKKRYALEAERSLAFLHAEIPIVKKRLVLSENKLEKYRESNGSVDLSIESKLALGSLTNIETQLNELVYEESNVATKYTKKHPIYIALINKRKILLTEKARLSKKIDKFPTTQREILRLTRVVKSDSQIYNQLKQKEQELSVVKQTAIGTVTILDSAHSFSQPIKPKKTLIVIMFTFLGFIISTVIVLLRYMMIKGIISTNEINDLGFEIYGNIPYSKNQKKIVKNKNDEDTNLLAIKYHDDIAIEALRLLRTNIYFLQKKMDAKVVMLCSPDVGAGKSFITTNLAILFAKSGKKVLVIDANMKNGSIASIFSIKATLGLSDYLKGDITLDTIITSSQLVNNLDVICCGGFVDNSSELLMTPKLESLMTKVSSDYDIVIIDTPASLATSDSVLISEFCKLRLVVGYFSKTSQKEIMTLKKIFLKNDIDITGFIVNGIDQKSSINCEFSHYTK
ncbi:Putative tyrosine-protein kinase in cps region [Photobacterium piscicola]|uniref:Putative tyrosine-protein kinase in cps region n=2 Tax=Photobacterium piscicola TaxID=1378299 RepID=A0A1T5I084_9GAMM|nr:Putative tyrosine-protein kinase in cps region [Photobacterium piscicola]